MDSTCMHISPQERPFLILLVVIVVLIALFLLSNPPSINAGLVGGKSVALSPQIPPVSTDSFRNNIFCGCFPTFVPNPQIPSLKYELIDDTCGLKSPYGTTICTGWCWYKHPSGVGYEEKVRCDGIIDPSDPVEWLENQN